MKKMVTMALLGLFCFGLAAMAQDVSYNFDQAADFSKFKSYKWVAIKDSQVDQLIDQQIKAAIDAELVKKGMTKTDNDKADLYIAYQVAVGQEKQINTYDMGGAGWGYGARWGAGYGGMSTSTTSTINIGNMVLDMYDPTAKQLVWRGKASKTLDTNAKPDKRQKNLTKAVTKLLKNYPPKKK